MLFEMKCCYYFTYFRRYCLSVYNNDLVTYILVEYNYFRACFQRMHTYIRTDYKSYYFIMELFLLPATTNHP